MTITAEGKSECSNQHLNSKTSTEMPDNGVALTVAETSLCFLMNAVSLVGNLLVCLAVYKNPRLRTVTNLYIIALAASDLLSATLVMPFTTGVLMAHRWVYGSFYCEIYAFMANYGLFATTSIMGLTAFNRYMRIVKPASYSSIFSPKRTRIILASVCVLVASYIAVPRFTRLQTFEFVPEYAGCHVVHLSEAAMIVHYCIVVFFFLALPFGVSLVCYFMVFKTIKQHNLEVVPALQSRIRAARITMQEIKISKSLFVVVLAFGMCWIPAWILAVVMRFCLIPSLPREVYLTHTALVFLSNSTNVFIYAGMNNTFKAEFRRLLTCSHCSNFKVSPVLPDHCNFEFQDLRRKKERQK